MNDIAFSPDDATLAGACEDGMIKIWTVPKPKVPAADVPQNSK